MKAIQAEPTNTLPVRAMCRVLGVSASGYYAWRGRGPSQRATTHAKLTEEIRKVHRASDATYGAPRIHAQLRQDGHCVSKKRVARLMRHAGIAGVSRRRGFTVTTERDKRQRPAPDLVQRQFAADAPNVLWVADMTYIPTWSGFVYLAIGLDVGGVRMDRGPLQSPAVAFVAGVPPADAVRATIQRGQQCARAKHRVTHRRRMRGRRHAAGG